MDKLEDSTYISSDKAAFVNDNTVNTTNILSIIKKLQQGSDPLIVYCDHMTGLIQNDLLTSLPGAKVRELANTRTYTILKILNSVAKGRVLQFLYESHLIDIENSIVSLEGTDLNGGDFAGCLLKGANLQGANCAGADFSGANLHSANLSDTNLCNAKLLNTTLLHTNIVGALYNQYTLWPEGIAPQVAGAVLID